MNYQSLSKTVVLLSLLVCSSNLSAEDSYILRAIRIDRKIDLKGDLSDPLWATAQAVEINFEIEPGENLSASQKTFAKVLYNSEYVYFGFRCEDSEPMQIRAQISDRDRMFNDDFIIVIFDVYGDNQRAYQFFVNPYGIQGDILRSGNSEDVSYDTVWESEAKINGSGWTAEMAIPFKSLRFPPKSEQVWTLLLARNYPRDSRYIFSWTPINKNNPCLTCQGGKLLGISGVESFTSYDLLPYAAVMQSGMLKDRSNRSSFENGPVKGRVGGSFRYAPNPDLFVEAVVNPDFSQIESDAGQISVNTTFALFFPERRPFFQAGSDQFNTRINAFYSRMINNPIAAAKVSTKVDRFSIAYLSALDRESPFIVPGQESSSFVASPRQSFSNIVRPRYDFGNQSFIGAIVTTRNFSAAHNYVGGIDWTYLFWKNFYFRGQALVSETKELDDLALFSSTRRFGKTDHTAAFDGEQYNGRAFSTSLTQSTREYYWSINYQDLSPTFQAHTGFLNKNDQRLGRFEAQYRMYPANRWLDRASLHAEGGVNLNQAGERKERWLFLGGSVSLKSQTHLFVGGLPFNQETFRGVFFPNIERFIVNINSEPSSLISMYAGGDFGKYIYRRRTPELGTGHNLSIGTTLKPTSQLSVTLSYTRSRMISIANEALLYDGYIARTVSSYQFTRNAFLRIIGQYDSFSKAIDIYPLFSYKLNPFTIFYVGSTYAFADLPSVDTPTFTRTARQYFLKFQYLLRY